MKITKKMLRDIIKEEMTSIKEAAGPAPDVAKLKTYMDTYKLTEFIAEKINTAQEFLELIKLMINLPGQVTPAQKSSILRTLITDVGKPDETTQQQQPQQPQQQPAVPVAERRTKKRRK